MTYQDQQIHYTTSAGLTHWNIEEPLDTALNHADRLLYQAKAQGRNRGGSFGNAPSPFR